MNNQLKYMITFSLLISCISAQLISQLPNHSPGAMITGNNSSEPLPLFDPARLTMNHSFSVSAMNYGNQIINVAAYTNMMNYTLNPNLHIGASFSLIQPTGMQSPLSYGMDKTQLVYDAHLQYKPTDNTIFEVRMSNNPYNNERRFMHNYKYKRNPYFNNYYK